MSLNDVFASVVGAELTDVGLWVSVGIASTLAFIAVWVFTQRRNSGGPLPQRTKYDYDAIVVGGSIAGPAVAKALFDQGRRVLLVERALWEKPDRIVGELLQPGGIMALETLGMKACATSVGSKCTGYMVIDDVGKRVSLPYEKGFSGVSFHFGDFVNNLRRYVWEHCASSVTMVEATVTDILTEGTGSEERAYGVKYLRDSSSMEPEAPFDHPRGHKGTKNAAAAATRKPGVEGQRREVTTATAPIVILCDGGASKFKSRVNHYKPAKRNHSHFVGLILEGIQLPEETRGHVFFGKTGPILSYRLDPNEVRFLVDYNKPELPSLAEQSKWLQEEVAPRLPEDIRAEFIRQSSDESRIRSMPISQYPQVYPSMKGVVAIGDHGNQRHPLTGGGMTCAMRDAIRLTTALAPIPSLRSDDPMETLAIQRQLQNAVTDYCRTRFLHSSCINILSWALYAVFGSPDMRSACFDYFLLGGEAVRGPMALLSGLDPNPGTLLHHYVKVMLNGAWNYMALTGSYSSSASAPKGLHQQVFNVLTFFVNPFRLYAAVALLVAATIVFTPLAWTEFVSLWRYVEPTSSVAGLYRRAERAVHRSTMGTAGKPVGL